MWIACLGVDPSVFYDVPGEQIESLSNDDSNAATATVSQKAATLLDKKKGKNNRPARAAQISFPYSTKQQRQITKFEVLTTM